MPLPFKKLSNQPRLITVPLLVKALKLKIGSLQNKYF